MVPKPASEVAETREAPTDSVRKLAGLQRNMRRTVLGKFQSPVDVTATQRTVGGSAGAERGGGIQGSVRNEGGGGRGVKTPPYLHKTLAFVLSKGTQGGSLKDPPP